jgi:hypothetical protein
VRAGAANALVLCGATLAIAWLNGRSGRQTAAAGRKAALSPKAGPWQLEPAELVRVDSAREFAGELQIEFGDREDVAGELRSLLDWDELTVWEDGSALPASWPGDRANASGRFWFRGTARRKPMSVVILKRPAQLVALWSRATPFPEGDRG